MQKAIIIVVMAIAGCTPRDGESIRLAAQVQSCIAQGDEGRPVSVRVRIALADDGSVMLIEVKGRNADQALYDAQDAVMHAVQTCAPYNVKWPGEFEIVLTY